MYIGGPQWRHIDLNGAFFAQSGGGKATFFSTGTKYALNRSAFPRAAVPTTVFLRPR